MTTLKVKQNLDNAILQLAIIETEPRPNVGLTRIKNFRSFFKAMELLNEISYSDQNTGVLVQLLSQQSTNNDRIDIDITTANTIMTHLQNLKGSLSSFSNLIGNLIKPIVENTILIKIVEPTDLKSFEKNVAPFDQILSQMIFHESIGGSIVYGGVEPGSTWIKVILGTKAAVLVIGGAMWAAAVISKKFKENELMETMIESQKIKNEQKEILLNANSIMISMMLDAEANHLYNQFYQKGGEIDHEQIARIKNSIKQLSEEINKGAEIHPALTEPEDVKNLFPDMKLLPTIQSKVQQIQN